VDNIVGPSAANSRCWVLGYLGTGTDAARGQDPFDLRYLFDLITEQTGIAICSNWHRVVTRDMAAHGATTPAIRGAEVFDKPGKSGSLPFA
jgi:hypothetical protein